MPETESIREQGIAISEGLYSGPVHLYTADVSCVIRHDLSLPQLDDELARYATAHENLAAYYEHAIEEAAEELGDEEADIFRSHLLMLNDPYFTRELPQLIRDRLVNAEWLVSEGVRRISETLGQSSDSYLRERVLDVEDVGRQLLHRLLDVDWEHQMPTQDAVVIVAKELTPSDIIRLRDARIKALVTELGTSTSHTAIIARSLGIPVVMGVSGFLNRVSNGDTVIVDGESGTVQLNPTPEIIARYHQQIRESEDHRARMLRDASFPAITTDGVRITLLANIVQPDETAGALSVGAEGIGLFRTEVPFLAKERLLSEEEQYTMYREAAEGMEGKPVVIRTLDLGGDKLTSIHEQLHEANPFLGWRSIRVSLHHREVFRHQLRAILRAGNHGDVQVMFPMISTVQELRLANALHDEVASDLAASGSAVPASQRRGIMVEVPSTAVLLDAFLPHTDFVSIGTNDLTQYTLAVDRSNELVSSYYQPADPAVLRLIRRTVRWSKRYAKPVAVCGEMAGQPIYAPLLIGIGVSNLSMAPKVLPEVKHVIRHSSHAAAVELARRSLRCATAAEVEELLAAYAETIPPL